MDLNFFNANIANPATLIPAIINEWRPLYQLKAYQQYDVRYHEVMDKGIRPDKVVPITCNIDGVETKTGSRIEKVTRIALAIQKMVAEQQAQFMTGGGMSTTADTENETEDRMLKAVNDCISNNKLDYRNGPLAETVLSQLEAAEIWYTEKTPGGKVRLRSKFYFPADGYQLMPIWDNHADLIAFGIQYDDVASKKRFLDLYTAEFKRHYVQDGSGWEERRDEPAIPLIYGKIPVIYYSIPQSAWEDVQPLIERIEKMMSNLGDTNDYNGSPILGVSGEVVSMANKADTGKIMQFANGADAKYISWDSKPESIIAEHDMLMRFIYLFTQTADLSLEAMQKLGDISGIAFKRMLINPHMKATKAHTGWYGEGIQRRLNFLVAAHSRIITSLAPAADLIVKPIFNLYSIDDERERIDNMLAANGGKPIIDHRNSIIQGGLVEDADATLKSIQDDEDLEDDTAGVEVTNDPTNPPRTGANAQ